MIGTRPLTDTEVSLLLESLPTLRDKCFLILGVKTGFRVSELLSLRVSDVLQHGAVKDVLTVEKRYTKGKVSSRAVPLGKEAINVLEAYVASLPKSQKWLFQSQKGNKLSRIQAWRVIKQAAISNKLKGKIATHSTRKSFASKVYERSGKDLVVTKELMGHKNINSTLSYLSFAKDEIYKKLLED